MNRLIEGVSIALAGICLVCVALWLQIHESQVGYLHGASAVYLVLASLVGWRLALPAAVAACLWQLLLVPNAVWIAALPVVELAWVGLASAMGLRPVRSGLILAFVAVLVQLFLLQARVLSGVDLALAAGMTGISLAAFVLADLALLAPGHRLRVPRPEQTRLGAILLDFALLPLLVFGVLGVLRQLDARTGTIADMSDDARVVAVGLGAEMHQHVSKLEMTAAFLTAALPAPPGALNLPLARLRAASPEFLSAIVADRNGRIIAASFYDEPSGDMAFVREGHDVSDRSYFQAAIEGSTFVSPVFRGRGFGHHPIIAIATPIHDHQQQVIGVLEASLNLEQALAVIDRYPGRWLIEDGAGRVARASPDLELPPLSPIPSYQGLVREVAPSGGAERYGAGHRVPGFHFVAVKLISREELDGPLLSFLRRWLMIAPLVFGVAWLAAAVLATELARPLRHLAARMNDVSLETVRSDTTAVTKDATIESSELVALNDAFERLTGLIAECRRCLASQVGGLERRNERLAERLAEADVLLRERTRFASESTRESAVRLAMVEETAMMLDNLTRSVRAGTQPPESMLVDIDHLVGRIRDTVSIQRGDFVPEYCETTVAAIVEECVERARRSPLAADLELVVANAFSAERRLRLEIRRLRLLVDELLQSALSGGAGRVEVQGMCPVGRYARIVLTFHPATDDQQLPEPRVSHFCRELVTTLDGDLAAGTDHGRGWLDVTVAIGQPVDLGSCHVQLIADGDLGGRLLERQLAAMGCRVTRGTTLDSSARCDVVVVDLRHAAAREVAAAARLQGLPVIGVGASRVPGVSRTLSRPVDLGALNAALVDLSQGVERRA